MNDIGHMHCQSDIDFNESKDIDASHEDDWDDEFKKDLECESGSHTTSTPKSNLEEVIDLVIQDAIDYANSPEDKRILPILTRKATKPKNKTLTSGNSINNHTFVSVQSPQQQVSISNNGGMMMSVNNQSSFHSLMQPSLAHGMQHMLQLAGGNKSCLSSSKTNAGIQNVNNISQPQQQISNAMMGFSSTQLPNIIIPTYNSSLTSNYSQNTPYSLPVSLSQIQLSQQQQSQLLLANNQTSFANLSTTSNNINFGSNSITSSDQQIMQSAYGNFVSNSSPYQIPGMIQAYVTNSATDNSRQNESQTFVSKQNSNPTCESLFLSTKTNKNTALTNNNASSSLNVTSSAVTSPYQTSIFDFQQSQLYAQQRLLQTQQQHHQQLSNSSTLFPDYAAVMARYGTYQ